MAQFLRREVGSPRSETRASLARDDRQKKKPTPWVSVILYLRWAIPVAVSFVGVGYILVEQVVLGGHSIYEPNVLRGLLIIGSAGPALVWITLNWAARATLAQAKALDELAVRNAEARRRASHLQTASLVGQRATALLDLDSMLAEVVALIRNRFGFYRAHIMLVDEETKELVLKESSGPQTDALKALGLRLKIGVGITGWVAESRQPFVSNDVDKEPRYYRPQPTRDTRSELAVPLRAGDRIVGVMDVQSDHVNAFDKEDVTVMQILGSQIGVAIENARLFQETKRRYNAMVALHETSLDMIAQLERNDLLKALLRRSAQLLGARGSSLSTYDPHQKLITIVARYNTMRDDLEGTTLQLGEGLIGRVILSGAPLVVNDYENWEGKSPIFTNATETRAVGAPLRWQDQIIGGIMVMNDPAARPFDQADVWLLSMFADLASIAVKNSELHSRVKDFNQQLEVNIAQRVEELSIAKEEIAEKAEQLKSLLAKTIHLQEEERARIARDMHDGVVQLITSARFEMQAARVVSGARLPSPAHKKLTAAREVLEEAENEIRRAIYDLHSPVLDAVGLVAALQQHVDRFKGLSGISSDLVVEGSVYRLPPETEVAVFRMIEESLNNVGAHADASQASVLLQFEPRRLTISIQDNGHGFDYADWSRHGHQNHLGLLGMRERIENLSGNMQVISENKCGTRIIFQLPVQSGA